MKKAQRKAGVKQRPARQAIKRPPENQDSCQMRRIYGWLEYHDNDAMEIGDFDIFDSQVSRTDPMRLPRSPEDTVVVKKIAMKLPSATLCIIPIRPMPKTDKPINDGHSWDWDGNPLLPTLQPSVHSVGKWHGWIRKGRMESCK